MRMERGERSTCTLNASTQVIKSEWQQGSDAQKSVCNHLVLPVLYGVQVFTYA